MKKISLLFQRNIFIAVRGPLRGPFTPGPRCAAPPAPVVVTALDLDKVYGGNAQLGGIRNRYERDVGMSTGKTTYGNNARVGGTHNDRKSNKI